MSEIVTLGELLIDMVSTQKDVSLFDAPAFEPKAGGAPANVAVGVKRLGRSTAFIGKVGADDFGRGLRRTLDQEGVDTRNLLDDPQTLTTLAFVSHSASGDPAFAFFEGAHVRLSPADLDVKLIQNARIFHFGSVSLVHDPARSATLEALRIARAAGVICSFDLNWRPALWGTGDISTAAEPLAEVDIIKMNELELSLVTGETDPQTALHKLRVPARLVLITLGAKGCIYRYGGQVYAANVPPVSQVVDATGAGDAFTAATLAGLPADLDHLNEAFLGRLMRRACQAGAITTTRRGAIPSLPRLEELESLD